MLKQSEESAIGDVSPMVHERPFTVDSYRPSEHGVLPMQPVTSSDNPYQGHGSKPI